MKKIAVVPGDGIGKEVVPAALEVVKATGAGSSLEFTEFDWSADRYLRDGTTIPAGAFQTLARDFDAIFVGALGDPRVPSNIHAKEILLGMRFQMDLYANVRPVKLLDEALCPLKGVKPEDVDFVVIRENTEGPYMDAGGIRKKDTPDEVAIQEEFHTRKGVERIIRFAFELAKREGRKKVLMADKSNAMTISGGLWQKVFQLVSAEYPRIQPQHMYIDALCMHLIRDPRQFDVIVTSNIFGDIVTDLAAVLQGGLGMAASANIHPGHTSMFEPVHGSAPPFAGKNIANPIGAISSAAMMLDYLGLSTEAAKINAAVLTAVEQKKTTQDIGGTLGTGECASWIAARITGQDSVNDSKLKLNSENTARGNSFRDRCREQFQKQFGFVMNSEISLQLNYGKSHKFDLVANDNVAVAECKAFSWTYPGDNVPSAKITTLREALGYLKAVSSVKQKFLVMKKDLKQSTKESLAAYFVRLNRELCQGVVVAEMEEGGGEMNILYS